MSSRNHPIDDWVQRYLEEEEPRSKSLMISVFGDSIAPYADGIWLGDVIELMEPLGINERLVRTSAFRLIDEGWLSARREGRRSYYTLTATGTRRFETAYHHIYTPPQDDWDGQWTMVLLPRNGDSTPDRVELKRDLEWDGFVSLAPGLLMHPAVPATVVMGAVDRLGLRGLVAVMRGQPAPGFEPAPTNELLARNWNLDEVGGRYERFLRRFSPLLSRLDRLTMSPAQAFCVQTLLIHSFRRANLHDPRLPAPMLPAQWPGLRAFPLCRDLYARTCELTRTHLHALPGFEFSSPRGSRLSMSVEQRFGGSLLA